MEKYIEQNGITYELRGEQYYPLLELPEQKEIGKYGRLHLEYLKEHRKGRYTNLLLEGTLNQRLCNDKNAGIAFGYCRGAWRQFSEYQY